MRGVLVCNITTINKKKTKKTKNKIESMEG